MLLGEIRFINHSEKGVDREVNKDDFIYFESEKYAFFAIFDGVSSSLSALEAVSFIKDFLLKNHLVYFFHGVTQHSLSKLLYDANHSLLSSGIAGETTVTVAVIDKNDSKVLFLNVGDSRAYETNPQYLKQLTVDHNIDTNKNVLTRCLGMVSLLEEDIEIFVPELEHDSRILLCTDGLYSFIENNPVRFNNIFQKNLKDVERSVVNEISSRNQDDATFILISFNV